MKEYTTEYHTNEELEKALEGERVLHVRKMGRVMWELQDLLLVAHTSPGDVRSCINALIEYLSNSAYLMQSSMRPDALRKSSKTEGAADTVRNAANKAAALRGGVVDEEG